MTNGVMQALLGIWNPVESADLFFCTLKHACKELVRSMLEGDFNLAVHKFKIHQASMKACEKRVELELKFVLGEGQAEGQLRASADEMSGGGRHLADMFAQQGSCQEKSFVTISGFATT